MTSPETECTSMEPEKTRGVAARRHPIPEKPMRGPAWISCHSQKIFFPFEIVTIVAGDPCPPCEAAIRPGAADLDPLNFTDEIIVFAFTGCEQQSSAGAALRRTGRAAGVCDGSGRPAVIATPKGLPFVIGSAAPQRSRPTLFQRSSNSNRGSSRAGTEARLEGFQAGQNNPDGG